MKKTAREIMCADDDVRRWYENLARSSRLTAGTRIRRLKMFQEKTGITPAELVRMGKENVMKAEDVLLDYVSWMESQGYSPGYMADVIKALKSWLTYNYVDIRRKIKIANARIPVTLENERVPTNEQLESIMNAADPRTRAAMSLMAFSGLRPKVIGNDIGTDGLVLSDLPELDVGDGTDPSFTRTPAMVVVRPQLSKAGHKYFTFLTPQGCGYLLGYLRGRIAHGERLNPQSPVLARTAGTDSAHGAFLTTKAVTAPIRKAIRSVMVARPYVLRAYFDTQLLVAESHGAITHAYRQFFMGHTGDMEARYTTNKGRLTEQMTDDMRGSIVRSETFLDAASKQDPEHGKRALLEAWRSQARTYGIDPSKVNITIEGEAPPASPAAAPESSGDPLPDAVPAGSTPAMRQAYLEVRPEQDAGQAPEPISPDARPYMTGIVTGDEDLLEHVARGWEVVHVLGEGRVLIRIKNTPHVRQHSRRPGSS